MKNESVLEFVSAVLEREGALVERRRTDSAPALDVLAPAGLRETLELDELNVLCEQAERAGERSCGWGSELLSRIAAAAISEGRVAAFRADLPPPRRRDPDELHGLNVSLRTTGTREQRGWVLLGSARVRASSDDELWGLVHAGVTAPGGVPIPAADLRGLPLEELRAGDIARAAIETAAPHLFRAFQRETARCLEEFQAGVLRRRVRDMERLSRYFEDMKRDLKRRLARRGGEPLRAKLESLPAERERRLAELRSECRVRVELEPVALVAVHGPGLIAEIEVRRRKHTRRVELWYDGVARRWTGLRCDGCGAAALAFAMCDAALHVLCKECWDSCGSGGHRPCFRCGGAPERGAAATCSSTAAAPPVAIPPVSTRPDVPASPDPSPKVAPPADCREDLERSVLQVLSREGIPLSSRELRLSVPLDAVELRRLLRRLVEKRSVVRVGDGRAIRYRLAQAGDAPGDPDSAR